MPVGQIHDEPRARLAIVAFGSLWIVSVWDWNPTRRQLKRRDVASYLEDWATQTWGSIDSDLDVR